MSNKILIYDKSVPERTGVLPTEINLNVDMAINKTLLSHEQINLPEVSELDVVRHFTDLASKNFSVDKNFYPLGSCTMKYNPKSSEKIASMEEFTSLHPFLAYYDFGKKHIQGALEVISKSCQYLCEITGMDEFTTQPMAGAHGEYTGILLVKKYHEAKMNKKTHVIVPDSSHGTNPASAAIAGYDVISVETNQSGEIDLEMLKSLVNPETAAIMLTCPNTLGIFETKIDEIAKIAHLHDTLLYYDGANLNALLGRVKPGELGFDIVHVNVHKTFATPHGGGGPGAGPVGVKKKLSPYMPVPFVVQKNGEYRVSFDKPESIGSVAPFFGNFLVILKSLAYIMSLGTEGLKDISENAVLNANYIQEKLKHYYDLPYKRVCMHECVFSFSKNSIKAVDIAKFLIDNGIHPPTVYFPLIVKEAIMIEPTETESLEAIDNFIENMIEAAKLAESSPETLKQSPKNTPIGRVNEVQAAKDLNISCF